MDEREGESEWGLVRRAPHLDAQLRGGFLALVEQVEGGGESWEHRREGGSAGAYAWGERKLAVGR